MDDKSLAIRFWEEHGREMLLRLICEDMRIYGYEEILSGPTPIPSRLHAEKGIVFVYSVYKKRGKDVTKEKWLEKPLNEKKILLGECKWVFYPIKIKPSSKYPFEPKKAQFVYLMKRSEYGPQMEPEKNLVCTIRTLLDGTLEIDDDSLKIEENITETGKRESRYNFKFPKRFMAKMNYCLLKNFLPYLWQGKRLAFWSRTDENISLLREIEANELKRVEDNDRCKKDAMNAISDLREASVQEFHSYCATEINVDAIVRQLKEKKVKNKKEEVELFASQFQSTIQQQIEIILSEKANELSAVTKEYLDEFSRTANRAYSDDSLHADFDVTWAFTSALSKIGILGGIGAFVLGEAAWLFLPISVVIGVAGDVALTAVALGPIGLVAGLAISGALGLVKLFGGGWEKSVAKKILKAFESNQIQEKYVGAINNYWEETRQAFDSAAQALDL